MNKTTLIDKLAEQTNVTRRQAEAMINTTLNIITSSAVRQSSDRPSHVSAL